MTLVLGIESSCDETGVGLVRDGVLVGHAIASSVDEHARFGGVVPEIAARAHTEALRATVQRALDEAGVTLSDVDVVAATAGPGLMSALLVGLSAAKAYALALDVPFYAIHHLAAHVAVATLDGGPLPEPCVALVVSGGHTSLLVLDDLVRAPVVHLGDTLDDAAGEAFDKVARLLGLPFPGGPNVDKVAREGDPAAVRFPRGLTGPGDAPYAFSFSGLKTAVARHVESLDEVPVADVAASFQESVADVLTAKAVRACQDRGISTLVAIGGVVANSRLRALLQERCDAAGITLRIPPTRLCTDNGAMVAALGWLLAASGAAPSDLGVTARASVALERALLA